MCRFIPKQPARLTYIRLRMPDITGPKIAVHRLGILQRGMPNSQPVPQKGKEPVQIGALADCNIIDLVGNFGITAA